MEDPNLPGANTPDANQGGSSNPQRTGADTQASSTATGPATSQPGATPAPSGAQVAQANPSVAAAAPKGPDYAKIRDLEIDNVREVADGISATEDQLDIKQRLSSERKLPVFIPLDPGEKSGAFRSVTINGYRCEVQKGKMIEVPESIARILYDAYNIESDVLNNNEYSLNNADDRTRDALGV